MQIPNSLQQVVGLLSTVYEDILHNAIRLILENGISTSHVKLLAKAGNSPGIKVRENRMVPEENLIKETLRNIKKYNFPSDHHTRQYHGWFDSIFPSPDFQGLMIRINDRAYCYADHANRTFHPLTRKECVDGTKLIHVLHQQYGVKGYACGTPQEAPELLKGIEQYLIGYRYNKLGGSTEVPATSELLDDFLDIREIAESEFSRKSMDIAVWSPSPLRLESDELNLLFYPGIGIQRMLIGSMPIMGLSGPVDPVGVFTLALAETLGGATIIHALFPEIQLFIMPHPQPMDLGTGMIAFGTIEHLRLELIKTGLFSFLDLPYAMVKDTLTSAHMPDFLCQADKMLYISTAIMHGVSAFSICPVSCDEGWNPVQCILDVEYIRNVWELFQIGSVEKRAEEALLTTHRAITEKCMFAEMDDTLLNMFQYYNTDRLLGRQFGFQKWKESGFPDPFRTAEDRVSEMLRNWDYIPPEKQWIDIHRIYLSLCKKFQTSPMDFIGDKNK